MQFFDVVSTDKAMQTIGIQISTIGKCARTKMLYGYHTISITIMALWEMKKSLLPIATCNTPR